MQRQYLLVLVSILAALAAGENDFYERISGHPYEDESVYASSYIPAVYRVTRDDRGKSTNLFGTSGLSSHPSLFGAETIVRDTHQPFEKQYNIIRDGRAIHYVDGSHSETPYSSYYSTSGGGNTGREGRAIGGLGIGLGGGSFIGGGGGGGAGLIGAGLIGRGGGGFIGGGGGGGRLIGGGGVRGFYPRFYGGGGGGAGIGLGGAGIGIGGGGGFFRK